jgi:Zn-dependent M28 family amino/carboxypeptidase
LGHTLVFIAFGAEEDRLRGSNVYVHAPVWPLERTRVVINFDMVGRNVLEWFGSGVPRSVGVVGLESSALHRRVAERAAADEGMALLAGSAELVARFGFDGRTDDWWFRQKGVATIHFSTGLHRDYHQPTDTADRLRPGQMARIARLATRVLVALAGRT